MMMMTSEYDAAIAFMRQFHSRQVTRPPEPEAPRSGGILSSIDESQSNIILDGSTSCCLQKNRIVRVRTVRCLVGLETGEH
mmetsp:Transcript_2046/g.3499  ORF Transcript_2046/g.3499 Transcript_2046/m.3499 type:complete len:81 (+) Transcript_2046:131-373(+)